MEIYSKDGTLYHHGVKGMKWGVRRYQNKDGSLTPKGKKRYGLGDDGELVKKSAETRTYERLANLGYRNSKTQKMLYDEFGDDYNRRSSEQWKQEADRNTQQAKRSFELDKIAAVDKKMAKQIRTSKFGENQNVVLSKRNQAFGKDKEYAKKWAAAFKAGVGSKAWSEYEKHANSITKKYKNEYINAWMKDNKIQKLSDQGRKYVDEYLRF